MGAYVAGWREHPIRGSVTIARSTVIYADDEQDAAAALREYVRGTFVDCVSIVDVSHKIADRRPQSPRPSMIGGRESRA